MTRIRKALGIICLAFASNKLGGHGYTPSHHPRLKLDIKFSNVGTFLRMPKTAPSRTVPYKNAFRHNIILPEKKPGRAPAVDKLFASSDGTITSAAVATTSRDEERKAVFVSGAAVLAGFTEVYFMAKFGAFVNMITGALVKMSLALANFQGMEAFLHARFVLSYMVGVGIFAGAKAAASRCQEASTSEANQTVQALCFVAPVAALLFAGADFLARHCGGSTGGGKAVQMALLAMAHGVVNTAEVHATGGTIFYALTGHVTRISNAIREFIRSRKWKLDAATRRSIDIVRSFLVGALAAAVLVRKGAQLSDMTMPVCTGLGLSYAALFGWYSPIMPVLRRWMATEKIVQFGRLVGSAFARRPRPQPILTSPIFVDISSEDVLLASNGTQLAAGF